MSFGELKTRCVYDIPEKKNNTVYILVSRDYPRGIKIENQYWDHWWLELAPSRHLLARYKENKNWEEYVDAFAWEMRDQFARNRMNDIRSYLAEGKNVELLCFERTDDFCHRRLLKHLIEERRM